MKPEGTPATFVRADWGVKMKQRALALVMSVLVLSLLTAGCTSYVDFSGSVYEWVNAPPGAKTVVYYGETPPSDYQLAPLEGARVFIEDEDHSHKFTMEAGTNGSFHLGTTVELAEDVIIDVSKSGYQGATRQISIDDDVYFYKFVVLLIPAR
jgi:hypothetical protein